MLIYIKVFQVMSEFNHSEIQYDTEEYEETMQKESGEWMEGE